MINTFQTIKTGLCECDWAATLDWVVRESFLWRWHLSWDPNEETDNVNKEKEIQAEETAGARTLKQDPAWDG